ncbi:hypothetical protein G6F37_002925 [Rhizopus arrhizus]|nr:hypothetical protein G6F38_003047 [Rhizopus arrhizus]KAG1161594.1 hypothetical protein G6F37_002925 [Rhizopus arrhizus]
MKSVRFSFVNNKFDNQYTFELQGYISLADFNSNFHLLNQSVVNNPPPGNKVIWAAAIWTLWVISIIANYFLWDNYNLSNGLMILPFFMTLVTVVFIWRHRVMCECFEKSVINSCIRINATENIRGINYRFTKDGFDINDRTRMIYLTTGARSKPEYSMVIEFDDRYNALSSQQFNRYPSIEFVTIPLFAHVNHAKEEKNRPFLDDQQHEYDEKLIV